MAKNFNLTVGKRDFSKKPRQLRAEGKVTATIYGHNFSPISIQLDAKAFRSAYKADKNAIMQLKYDNDTYSALVKNVQYGLTTDEIFNIEFYRIKTDEKVKVSAPVNIVGESPAVKAGGTLWNPQTEIEIECLPTDIPRSIDVDISGLENFEDLITVRDIKYPAGISPVTSPETMIVKINAPTGVIESPPVSEEVAKLT
ncbi:MAG: hypothetical protein A2287_06220 [Candidatus Melainabacteria bacterium RIFOXYA12_FULL_32_12]|nr:MAG: hypothetical protein A2255_06425 [Candidatus Melainabacteria bacterium RIFOXYA2_FULL_32_9]OGI28205.1 MAG: hypothetical protein A2287_06220 [Candidatus Melainabacteria bacterium RIFOXYA12_FULL_32_12]